MSKIRPERSSRAAVTLRKFFLSGFVVFTFAAYAIHERLVGADAADLAPASGSSQTQLMVASPQPTVPQLLQAVSQNQNAPTSVPAQSSANQVANQVSPTQVPPTPFIAPPTAKPQGLYVDGDYIGPVTDAWYGTVQVKAIIRDGKIADVQFLDYPNDRRTSQQINHIAMPYLTQEAIQAQSAYVNIISGATLTSEAFAQSLYSALNQAKNQL